MLALLGHEELDGSRVGGVPGLSGEPAQALAITGLAELEALDGAGQRPAAAPLDEACHVGRI